MYVDFLYEKLFSTFRLSGFLWYLHLELKMEESLINGIALR